MSQRLQVLLVENLPSDSELVVRELRRAGFDPVWVRVETEEQYLRHLETRPDIVLSDYDLPEFSALRALEILKERGLEIPFIIVSGTIGEEVAVEAMKLGAADYLLKDRLGRLGLAIAHAMEKRRMRTERKQQHEALHLREEALSEVSQGVLICDEKRNVIYANAGFATISGYSESEMLGESCSILQGPDTDPETVLKIRAALDAGKPFEGEILNYRKDGTPFWNDLSIAPIHSPEGGTVRFIGIQRDITERKKAQHSLGVALERLQLAIKAGRAGTWDFNLLTGDVDWDEQMLALYGETAESVSPGAERWSKAIHGDDLAKTEAAYVTALQIGKESFETEFRIRRGDDGTERFIRGMGVVRRDEEGQAVRMTGINWDVTQERRREQQLSLALAQEKELSEKARAGERAKSEFLAVMSHEIRTPMNGILGFSELLASSSALPAECRDYVRTITTCGEALLRILDDVLDFSRLEAGGMKIEKSLFRASEVVGDIKALLALSAQEKKLTLQIEMAEETSDFFWNDAGRLRQVLLNLAGNAVKFTERGTVTLGMRVAAEEVDAGEPPMEFFVRDTGPGIPEAKLEHIFQPFAQLDSTTSRCHGGMGLGLAISQHLVELMGGTLTVESRVGEGFEFRVTLPIEVPEGTTSPPANGEGEVLEEFFAKKYPLRVLLVEDDYVNLKLMLMILRKLGYEPLVAQNGDKAVDIFQREQPDCVLMDLQMPHRNGIQATIKIREMEKITPGIGRAYIAALTANIVTENRSQCFAAGMDGYLNKPIRRAQLARTLERASSRRRLDRLEKQLGCRD